MKKWLLFLTLFVILDGCMMGPNYKSPQNVISDEWQGTSTSMDVSLSNQDPIIEWWKVFEDPLLNKYIEMAALYNKDMLIAEANVLQARAMRKVTASALFPQIFADLNATKTYFSKNGPLFAIGSAAGNPMDTSSVTTGLPFQVQFPQVQNLFNALIDASWEIDLFGKTRRSVQAADATIESTMEQRNDTLISVMGEIARNYMELRSNQTRQRLIEENIKLLEQNAEIVKKNLEAGYVNKLNHENIEAELATARSALPDANAQIYLAIYTLSILTGQLPETLIDELLPIKPLPKLPREIAVGLRSDLLRRRPDVRRSERQLAAATANVGVAVASFFPTITLTGDGGFQSLAIQKLFQARSITWAYGGDINLPIFQGGLLVGNLRANRAAEAAAGYTYQKTVLTALREAESAIVSYTQDIAKTDELYQNTESNYRLVQLMHARQTQGLVGMIDLLDSKRQLNVSEQNLLQTETASLLDLILLYKALGGGWHTTTPTTH